MTNKPLDKSTFFYHFQQSTGGLYDPRIVKQVIKHLEEWLPDCLEADESSDYNRGQGDYLEFLLNKLIQKDYKNW